jgi:LPS export ABC transporter protein LptC
VVRRFWPYALTFVALAAIAAGFFYRSGREPRITDLFDVPKLGEDALPELLQRIRDFHRVVTRKGEKILEISASEASYFRDSNAVEIKAPRLVFFHQGERVGSIEADRGWIVIEDTELRSADLEGSVRLVLTKFAISADAMRYDRQGERIQARGLTEVKAPDLELRGRDMLFDLRAHQLTVQSGVSMQLKRSAKATPPAPAATPPPGPQTP